MENEIYEKLEQISDLKERITLKNILEGVFTNLYHHSEEMYQALEQRVFQEIAYEEDKYNIYTSIVSKNEYDPIHSFLYPMSMDDLQDVTYDLENLLNMLLEHKKSFVFKIFFECDYLMLKEILRSDNMFKGTIRTDKKSYTAYFELEKDESYNMQIQNLYEIFINNQIPWRTINAPYINKIVRVNLVGIDGEIDRKEEIEEIIIDFGEYTHYVKYGMIPLWNVQKLEAMGMGFAMPCENKVFYEHKVSLIEIGHEHGYVVDAPLIQSIRHTKDYLYIIAPIEESISWKLFKITRPKSFQTKGKNYPLMTNAKKANFIDKLSQKITYPIKTKAELLRLLNVLEAADDIELAELKIIDEVSEHLSETYDLNPFIIDEIRDAHTARILLLSFYAKGKHSYITRDILSFIVSEIQHYYPEYKCEGQLR